MFGPNCDWAIATGFKEAADRVVDSLAQNDTRKRVDIFFFPVVYLYRHAIELCLKRLVVDGVELGLLGEDDALKNILSEHNLHKLWNKVRFVLKSVWPNGDDTDLKAAERMIIEFHQADESGQRLRYSQDKDGKSHADTLPSPIDLARLRESMRGLFTFFDGCSAGLAEAKNWIDNP